MLIKIDPWSIDEMLNWLVFTFENGHDYKILNFRTKGLNLCLGR